MALSIGRIWRWVATVLLALLWTGQAQAGPRQLPSLPIAGIDATLLSLDDHPAVVAEGRVLILRDQRGWTPLAGRLPLGRAGIATARGHVALFDKSGKPVRQIGIVGLVGDRVAAGAAPLLPVALNAVQATWEGDTLLVGGTGADGAARLFSLQPAGWSPEPAWPGGALTSLAAQNRVRVAILADGRLWRWATAAGWRAGATAPGAAVPGSGASIGQAHLLYALTRAGKTSIETYSTITDAWAPLARLSGQAVGAVRNGAGLVVLTREGLWQIDAGGARNGLAPIDIGIIAVYMLAMLGMGLYFYTRANADSADEFFLGNRAIPFWAAGLSMFAGTIGSVNYLAYPAKSFETDWQYLMSKLTYVGALVVVALCLAPFFRRLNLVSVNTYLEDRFALGIRLLASGLWIVLQLGARMGIILYLPALAINTMTGVDIVACILAVGIFTIVYTALGGMRAVVWTDVVQVFVLIGGALFAIGFIIHDLGFATLIDTTASFNKTRAINLSLDVKQPTIWTFLLLAGLEGVLCFPRDQIVMQRVLSTATPKEATWSILTFAAILLPSAVLFYGIGTALFAFYRAHPAALDPTRPIDAVFPTFIGTQLPHGVVGLVVAGVLAAAMGVLSGIINSVATLLSVDFYARFRPQRSQRQIVRFSEYASVVVGSIGIVIAIILSRLNVHSLLDLTIELGGVFGGSFAGAFPLGMFSRRANWQGAAIGIITSAAVTMTIWAMQAVHPYLYLAIAIAVSLGVGWVASLFFPPPARSLAGLTVFTRGEATRRALRSPA